MAINRHKRTYFFLLLLVIVAIFASFLGGIAHKYEIQNKIPGVSYVTRLLKEKIEVTSPFFYPSPKEDNPELFEIKDVEYPFTFLVYGDSREIVGHEKTDLIEQILNESFSFVIHLGDMVFYGEEHQWELFNLFDRKILDSGRDFYPVLGNHEYYTRMESYAPDPKEQLNGNFEYNLFLIFPQSLMIRDLLDYYFLFEFL